MFAVKVRAPPIFNRHKLGVKPPSAPALTIQCSRYVLVTTSKSSLNTCFWDQSWLQCTVQTREQFKRGSHPIDWRDCFLPLILAQGTLGPSLVAPPLCHHPIQTWMQTSGRAGERTHPCWESRNCPADTDVSQKPACLGNVPFMTPSGLIKRWLWRNVTIDNGKLESNWGELGTKSSVIWQQVWWAWPTFSMQGSLPRPPILTPSTHAHTPGLGCLSVPTESPSCFRFPIVPHHPHGPSWPTQHYSVSSTLGSSCLRSLAGGPVS